MQISLRLRRAGVRIATDDFGMDYSSLARLSQLPIDTIKIDRSFTGRLIEDRASRAIVTTIITLAHSLELNTVAEAWRAALADPRAWCVP